VEAMGRKKVIFDASGVHGMVATEEEFAIPADDDVLEVGRERSM
jgi:hypothetical protein